MGSRQWSWRRMQQPTIERSIKYRWWPRNRGVMESQADRRQRNNWLRRMRMRCGGGVGGMCDYNNDTMLLLPPTDVRPKLTRGDGAT